MRNIKSGNLQSIFGSNYIIILIAGSLNQLGSRANHVMFKKALNDEFETLLCLKICAKFEDGAIKLVEHHSGKNLNFKKMFEVLSTIQL